MLVLYFFTISLRQLPPKLMREWTDLFVSGHPLYTERLEALPAEPEGPTPAQIIEEERQQLLDEGDFAEYKVTSTKKVFVSCNGPK